MPLNAAAILDHRFPDIRQSYTERDAILYALGLGLGSDPMDERDLDYLLETRLKVLPTMATTLASPGLWLRDPIFGADWVRLVHAAQTTLFHKPLPPRGEVIGRSKVVSLSDRGEGRGAVLIAERIIADAATGEHYASLRQTLILRGDGGYGGQPPKEEETSSPPQRAADQRVSIRTSPRAALIYRLSGDLNPIHSDPAVAKAAGFKRPILHGLASYGTAGVAICRTCAVAPNELAELSVRFSGIVVPGDMLDLHLWREPAGVLFEVRVGDRTVLSRGRAIFRGRS